MLKVYSTYIHIPFCEKKCNYCDFTSFHSSKDEQKKYILYLKKEIELYKRKFSTFSKQKTIYFGGGTPSIIDEKHIKDILNEFTFDSETEITIEVNPKTITQKKLENYLEIGINRLSIGVQSFKDINLKSLGRIHNSEDAIAVYELARKVGFKNISLDLIFSLPNQTLIDVENDLLTLFALSPEHFSIYSLIWEENTRFYEDLKRGKLKEVENEEEAEMYERIIHLAKIKGYSHYEISNFSKEGFYSKHNLNYWKNLEYLAFGLSASGYIGDLRYKNISNLKNYYKSLDEKRMPIQEREKIDVHSKEQYKYLLGFRILNESLKAKGKYLEICERLVKENFLYKRGEGFLLTEKGLLLFNDVVINFL